jgi:putative nucleotidyltransferase with HDIG domain
LSTSPRRPRQQHFYIVVVAIVGLALVGRSIWRLSQAQPGVEWFLLAALTLLTGSFTVKVPSLSAKISVSETFVFTSVLLFGTEAGIVTVVLDALVISLWMSRDTRPASRVLFNVSAPPIALGIASSVFFYLSGATSGQISRADVPTLIAPIFLFSFLYFLTNTALVATAIAIEVRKSVVGIWRQNFPAVSITYFVGGSIALLIVAYTDHIDLSVLSIIIPLLVISYLTFRTSMGRLEDADRHIIQMREMYLSTVETLAMAVDAKDQITHGHIRRVQVFALGLAKRLGVSDETHLQAIQAAALLHDMGKLAIPEHILNKPGKLTATEFDRMKQHASIGADLLSSIKFPYPVVPIVRHHHEQWNGGGYPAGIAGTDIPLGARILSVVDCFDALTSDRPYRPRLQNAEALSMLRERSGTMYDPLIVHTFVQCHSEIAPAAIRAGQEAKSLLLGFGTGDSEDVVALKQIRANASETSILLECGRKLPTVRREEALEIAARYLRQLTPARVFAFFAYDRREDVLRCEQLVGDPHHLLAGLVIRPGERVTGWSAANRRTTANSNAALDLLHIAELFTPPLKSCVSAPLIEEDSILGVLSVYATQPEAFTEQHRYVTEQIASVFGERLRRSESHIRPIFGCRS